MVVSALSLTVVAVVVLGTVAFALFSVRRIHMSPQEYIVGGRSFGAVFLWVLMAGEIYTSFTFLGAAGWAYSYGAPAFYILAYGPCGYIIGFFLLPAVWRVGKKHGLLTSPDFLVHRYGSKTLGVMAALVQSALIVPYVTLQLSGLQILLTIAGYGTIDATLGAVLAFLLVAGFVFTAGLRGTAWASIVKDALVLGAVVFVGIAIPWRFFGSPAKMFDQVMLAHPDHMSLISGTSVHGTVWYVTTVLLSGIGFFMNPSSIAATYAAKDENVVRRNAMYLPLYSLVMLLVFFGGFAALLITPGLKGHAADQSFLLIVQRFYGPWVLGFVCAAGALCALVPATALLLGAASVVAKNVVSDALGLAKNDRSRLIATRTLVVFIALLSLGLWLVDRDTLVGLLLVYYSGITQFAPAFMLAFLWPRANAWGIGTGIAGGLIAAAYFTLEPLNLYGVNPGFIALAINVALVFAVSLLTPRRETPA